jgi:hypothetical protein
MNNLLEQESPDINHALEEFAEIGATSFNISKSSSGCRLSLKHSCYQMHSRPYHFVMDIPESVTRLDCDSSVDVH